MDINECIRGTAGCAAHAGCINTEGGFSCACDYGYSGAAPIRAADSAARRENEAGVIVGNQLCSVSHRSRSVVHCSVEEDTGP